MNEKLFENKGRKMKTITITSILLVIPILLAVPVAGAKGCTDLDSNTTNSCDCDIYYIPHKCTGWYIISYSYSCTGDCCEPEDCEQTGTKSVIKRRSWQWIGDCPGGSCSECSLKTPGSLSWGSGPVCECE